MKIVIAGAGEVGYHLIENLCREDLDISVIDTNGDVLNRLKNSYDVTIEQSNIIDSRFLNRSYLEDTDIFLAITNSDETNMIACKTASEGGAKKTICRIRQVNFAGSSKASSLKSLGIDVVINPVDLVAEELYHLVLAPNTVDSHEFCDGEISLVGYTIQNHCTLLDKKVGDLEKELHDQLFHITIIQRGDISIIPDREDVIKHRDVVYFFCPTDGYQKLKTYMGYRQKKFLRKRIFINGGGHIGVRLAKRLEEAGMDVKIIEKDPARSLRISEKLEKALVLNFDGTDMKQLTAEGIEYADYFFSVTDNDPVNLTSCLLACEKRVAQTICLVKQQEYISILDKNTPVSLGVSPRVLTARYLIHHTQGENVKSYFALANSQIEVMEIHLDDQFQHSKIPLCELNLPGDVRIGLIERSGKFLLPSGDNVLLPDDKIIITLHRMDRRRAMTFFQSTGS